MKIKKYVVASLAIIAATIGVTGLSFYQRYQKETEPIAYVKDEPVTAIEYNFYYSMIVNNYYTVYKDYLDEIGLDVNKNFSEQECLFDGYDTWQDFFVKYTESSISEQKALCDDAKSKGVSFNSDDDWDSFKKQIENQAVSSGTTVSNMYKSMYGNYANEKNVKKIFEQYNTARLYELQISREVQVTDEEIEAAYPDYSDNYDTVTYLEYDVQADIDENSSDEEIEEAMEKAEKEAKEFFDSVYDEKTFGDLAKKNAGEDYQYKHVEENINDVARAASEWLFDCTTEKQTTYIKDETANVYRVLYFISRQKDNTPTATIRHILVAPTASNGSFIPTDEDYEKAKEEAEKILKEFNSGEKTEESFAELAKKYSQDTGTSENGGLITSISPGSYEEELDNWIFNEEREPGNTGILKTTFGYHIAYYVEAGEAMWKTSLRAELKTKKIDEQIIAISNGYEFKSISSDDDLNIISENSNQESNKETDKIQESTTEENTN